ncbi:hemerythrin domain-containing protein [Geomonas sp.]|uniref:hemerythrin domain-containing protein n=1 Tax=Geomonas sp. TaxID=2651584 RepID=UPI002B49A948|nr:hemerythrin domain-containing protein [Geomonas sp.]HJV33636.1 hemerythrin domain-containing protein [Geomonas sp.]
MPQKAFEILKRDHRQAEKLMTQIAEGGQEQRQDLFETLRDALQKHMQMEEKLFYPEVKKISELKDLASDAIEEHEKTKKFLSELENMHITTKEWLKSFTKMQEGVLHHVQDEEKKVFPGCTKYMQPQLLQQIGEKVTEMKERTASGRK